jgi:glucokinase
LGEAFSIPDPDGSYRVFGSEGGHADFAPRSAVEYQLLSYLLDRHGIERVSVERVVSGRGIASIYEFFLCRDPDSGSAEMAEVYSTWREEAGKPEKTLDLSERIATFAQERADSLCERTMKLFIDAYGAEAGNLALKLLPYGGLYIAGGVAARNATLIKEGGFLSAFLAKGRMSSLLRRIPVYLVLDRKVGLLGAASRARRA